MVAPWVKIASAALLLVALSLTFTFIPFQTVTAQEADTETIATSTESTEVSYTFEMLPNTEVLGDFVVGPGKAELEIPAGESRAIELFVTNRTGFTRDFSFAVEDIAGSTDASRSVALLGDDRGPYTLRDYIDVPTEPITLDHAERIRIPLTISVPADAEPGGRYGSVLVSVVTQEAEEGASGVAPRSAIVARIGALFFVTVPGDIVRDGELKDFGTIPNNGWFSEGPITFSLLFENRSSIHLNPYGEIRITNMLGEEVGFLTLDPWFALPQSLRLREMTWERELLMGRYVATAQINRGYDDIVDTKEIVFWVIPWKLIGVAFALLFVLILLIRLFFKKFEFRSRNS